MFSEDPLSVCPAHSPEANLSSSTNSSQVPICAIRWLKSGFGNTLTGTTCEGPQNTSAKCLLYRRPWASLIAHYQDAYPVWVFLEVCEFGTLVDFYRFCADRWDDRAMLDQHYILKSVKAIRNATAHNCCTVNGLTSSGEAKEFPISAPITRALNAAGMNNSKTRRKNLANLRIAQIAAVLYSTTVFCTRESSLKRNADKFHQVKRAIVESAPLFRTNNAVESSLAFIVKLIDIWLPAAP